MIRGIFPARREDDTPTGAYVELSPRGRDGYGSGAFLASRGSRLHNGFDLAAPVGTGILSPVAGTVTKIGYPYADDLSYRYVQILDGRGRRHRVFYVDPLVLVDDTIEVDDLLGTAQDLTTRYNQFLMTNHVHYEVKTPTGEFLNPETLT